MLLVLLLAPSSGCRSFRLGRGKPSSYTALVRFSCRLRRSLISSLPGLAADEAGTLGVVLVVLLGVVEGVGAIVPISFSKSRPFRVNVDVDVCVQTGGYTARKAQQKTARWSDALFPILCKPSAIPRLPTKLPRVTCCYWPASTPPPHLFGGRSSAQG